MGVGHIGGRYCDLYGAHPEPRDALVPVHPDVLFTRSTVDNYWPTKGDLRRDIDTNLTHLMDVLPNVRGTFTFTSSFFVYGFRPRLEEPGVALTEEAPCDPRGFYSSTKLCAEHLVRSYCEMVGRPYRILRLGNVIGNDPRAGKQKNALEHMLRRLVQGEEVQVYVGDCYRDILHVTDTCAAIHCCLTKGDTNTIYNVGRGQSHRMWDIVHYAAGKVGSKSRITLIDPPRFHQQVQVDSFHMSTTKLRALGWTPSMTVWESVDRILARL